MTLPVAPPLSLYVHLPWCVRKCPYCDFNSHALGASPIPETRYLDALIRDLERESARAGDRPLLSLFFGGGSPSLFSAAGIGRLLTRVGEAFNVAAGAEITLEANPGTAEAERFAEYREAGVNRLSLGVQSLDDGALRRLGRIHDAEQAVRAARLAVAAGFDNLNLDLMFGLPAQTVAGAIDDLEGVLDLKPAHVSWYQLTIEPNTVFYSRPPVLPDEDLLWEIQEAGQAVLSRAGYRQYEVSAWASGGRRCRHNLNYWEFGDYLGLGAGAHGKLTDPASGSVHRYARHRLPSTYMERAGTPGAVARHTLLAAEDLVLEFLLNAGRLTEGFPLALFHDRTGLSCEVLLPRLQECEADGLIYIAAGCVRPTAHGRRFLNELLLRFLPEPARHAPAA